MVKTFEIPVSAEEANFLCNNLPAGAQWQSPSGEVVGGTTFRLKVIALRAFMVKTWTSRTPESATLPLTLTEDEVWMLDFFCNTVDYSKVMGNGTPLITFVTKLWDCLLAANVDAIDERYLPAVPAPKIEVPPEVREKHRAFLAEIDSTIEGAEKTANGEQFID